MSGFDVVLGMDWLSFHRAVIDCYRRRVTICTLDGDCFSFTGDRSSIVSLTISDRCTRYSLICLLASLTLEEWKVVQKRLPPVISEFHDVFFDPHWRKNWNTNSNRQDQ